MMLSFTATMKRDWCRLTSCHQLRSIAALTMLLLAFVGALGFHAPSIGAEESDRPNTVLIMADDK